MVDHFDTLTAADLRKLLVCAQRLSNLEGVEDFHAHALEALRGMVDDDWIASETYTSGEITWQSGLVDPVIPGDLYEVFVQRADENPMLNALESGKRSSGVMTWESVIRDAKGHEKLPIYHDFYRKLEIHQQAAVYAVLEDGTLLTHGFSREHTYSDGELALLHGVLPHLTNAFNNWRSVQDLRRVPGWLADGVDAAGRPLALLDADGGLKHLTPGAARLLQQASGGARVLPEVLRAWIKQAVSVGQSRFIAPAPLMLSFVGSNGDGGVVRVRLVRQTDPEGYLLVFETQATAPSIDSLQARFKLTGQQARVTCYLLGSLGQKQIAGQLGLTYQTVRSYTKQVYGLLGVQSREELVALVRRELL